MKQALILLIAVTFLFSCNDKSPANKPALKTETKHHLNIPEKGIESLMESNSQKIIEGTDGSIVLMIGNVTRKEADITLKLDNKILEEKMMREEEDLEFNYEGSSYTLHIGHIKKPLLGEGKVNIRIK